MSGWAGGVGEDAGWRLFCWVFYAELDADGIHRTGHHQAEFEAHLRAFDASFFQTFHDFPDLVFEAVDHGFELNGMGVFAGAIPGEAVVFVPGGGDADLAAGAGDFGGDAGLAGEGAADDGGCAVWIFEDGVAGVVGACGGTVAGGDDAFGLAEEVGGQEEGVDADIEEGAAAEAEIIEATFGVEGGEEAEIGADVLEGSELAFGDDLVNLFGHGQEAGPHGFHEEGAVASCGVDHLGDLFC